MKDFIGGAGVFLAWITGLGLMFEGILIMNAIWGVAGTLIGIFIFPIPLIIGFLTIFSSWGVFLLSLVWFGLVILMVDYGDKN